jgi:hypothetical protein
MKQTAVEWLCEQYHLKQDIEIVKEAIEMEKEQMRSASCPYIGGWEEGEFEYWYNEKYKK